MNLCRFKLSHVSYRIRYRQIMGDYHRHDFHELALEEELSARDRITAIKADSKIGATWWITNTNIDNEKSGGGCNSAFAALAFVCLPALAALSRKKRA